MKNGRLLAQLATAQLGLVALTSTGDSPALEVALYGRQPRKPESKGGVKRKRKDRKTSNFKGLR